MKIEYLIRELEKLLHGKIGDEVAIIVFKLENDTIIKLFEMDYNEVITDNGINFEDIKELEFDSFQIDNYTYYKKCIWVKAKGKR